LIGILVKVAKSNIRNDKLCIFFNAQFFLEDPVIKPHSKID